MASDDEVRAVATRIALEQAGLERRQNRRRIAFIAFVLLIVFAQSFQGRSQLRNDVYGLCVSYKAERDAALTALRADNYADLISSQDPHEAPRTRAARRSEVSQQNRHIRALSRPLDCAHALPPASPLPWASAPSRFAAR